MTSGADHRLPRRPPVRMCARCQRVTEGPVLVHEHHGATGPGFNVYACVECAPHYPPPTDGPDVPR
ncbi:hypothetical protein [Streptomyces europaeiscabiei]|uniref:hypothetical protein n=1 Tax=Streptomyces europaeiscabiei TaxID=146819 RepID=UPI002E15E6D8|nr:hypothetical protein OHB30_18080 [Streptomyces europaeiscabiei]